MSRRPVRRWAEVGWCVGLAALAVGIRWYCAAGRTVLVDNDSGGYIVRAREIAEGGSVFHPFKMGGYPLLIDLFHLYTGDWAHAARAVSLVAGALLAPATYLLARSLYGRFVGLAAAALVVINLALIDIAGAELPEAAYALILLTAVAATIAAARHGGTGRWALAGLCYGASYWVRPEGVFLLGIVPALAALDAVVVKERRRGLARQLAAFVLGGAVLVVPNILAIHRVTGVWTVSGRTVWAGLLHGRELDGRLAVEEALRGLTPDKAMTRLEGGFQSTSAVGSYSADLGFRARELVRNWRKTARLLWHALSPTLLVAVVVGLGSLRWRWSDRRAELYIIGALIPWATVYPLYEVHLEKLATVLPLLLVWAALGLIVSAGWLAARWPVPRWPTMQTSGLARGVTGSGRELLVAGMILLLALTVAPHYWRQATGWDTRNFEDDPAYRLAGEWVDRHLPRSAVVVARKTFVAAYAGRPMVMLPYAEYPDVIAYARRRGGMVLALEERYKSLRPQLTFLFDGRLPPDLAPLLTVSTQRGERIILFRVLPAPANPPPSQLGAVPGLPKAPGLLKAPGLPKGSERLAHAREQPTNSSRSAQ